VLTIQAANLEIRESYFYGTMNGDGDSRGLLLVGTSDMLVEDNIFEHLPLPVSIFGLMGAVVAYNFTTDSAFVPYPDIMIPGISTEGNFTAMCLFEGNYTTSFQYNNNHGAGGWNTAFRNRMVGWEKNKTNFEVPITVNYMNHHDMFVGNVLGKAGFHNN
jgi:hypothetical protein